LFLTKSIFVEGIVKSSVLILQYTITTLTYTQTSEYRTDIKDKTA